MENQRPPAKRRREEAAAEGSMELEDRVSQLPQHILHNHVLSLLPRKDAIRTCILSKSWHHLGPTHPKFEFHESDFRGSKKKLMSVVENSLQRYVDQNLSIEEFVLRLSRSAGFESNNSIIPFLDKWIPMVIMNWVYMKTFKLTAHDDYSLPSVVFQAEFLEELYLQGCKLNQINNCNVKLHMLKRLSLMYVSIEEENFEKIMSSCPLIQHLAMETWESCSYHLHNNYFFPHLKSLYLGYVHLPTESLNNLSSNNCPCLEELQLHYCIGSNEIKLTNRSIKRLIIRVSERPIKAAIDAANMLYFEFTIRDYLPSISFAATSNEWKSHIVVWCSSDLSADALSAWSLKLHEFLKALSQSQISLDATYIPLLTNHDTYDGDRCEPVVVEHLLLRPYYSSGALPTLLNCVFRICRPRYISLSFSTYF